eukprot:m.319192 g.319192  ORF g.319192 m.319192 type:complete len:142 (+) comp20299_c0_seq1:1958-2383(+)
MDRDGLDAMRWIEMVCINVHLVVSMAMCTVGINHVRSCKSHRTIVNEDSLVRTTGVVQRIWSVLVSQLHPFAILHERIVFFLYNRRFHLTNTRPIRCVATINRFRDALLGSPEPPAFIPPCLLQHLESNIVLGQGMLLVVA